MNSKAEKLAAQHNLILSGRISARKMAQSMLRRWNVTLEIEEVRSIADLALCEAARKFDAEIGVSFTTFLFHYLKGALIRSIVKGMKAGKAIPESALSISNEKATEISEVMDRVASNEGTVPRGPEHDAYRDELRRSIAQALGDLSNFEREVVLQVHIQEFKVAHVARALGYSRGHVSAVRRDAFRKIRPMLERFKEAA